MTTIDRCSFIHTSAAGGLLLASSLQGLVACNESSTAGTAELQQASKGRGGYGELRPSRHCRGLISIPDGFHARLISQTGDDLGGGGAVPSAFGGMGAFGTRIGVVRLVRNHARWDGAEIDGRFGDSVYDAGGPGGTTTTELRMRRDGSVELIQQFASLTGTLDNAAGGITPWGSWISCEAAAAGRAAGWARNHGYAFEVPAGADEPTRPVPLSAMGRFARQAIAVDPATGNVYQTEKRNPSGVYRFAPTQRGNLAVGGVLQALKIRGIDNFDTRNHTRVRIAPGQTLQVEWVTIDEPDIEDSGLAADFVFCQGEAQGAAQFARIEECWYADRSIYFNAPTGGPIQPGDAAGSSTDGGGQVWQYVPAREQLTLVLEPPPFTPLKRPRNLCLSSGGGIVFSEAGRGSNYLRGLTQAGQVFDFIRNDLNDSPWVAACFSPQRRTLFVNIQGETRPAGKADPARGMTFAIWGPWESGAL